MPPKHSSNNPARVAVVGTYVPRRCGIATFSNDLLTSLRDAAPESDWWAVAMNDSAKGYDYPPEVQFEIGQNVISDYRTAVDFLNMNRVEAVSLQHEFGIYGGRTGSHVLRLLQNLRMPVVTTLHTVLREPSPDQREITEAIGSLSDRVVVMSDGARELLVKSYGIPRERIAVIPHGVPDVPFLDTSYHKDQFGLVGRKVILSFGLISRGKGYEYVIEALPEIVKAHPEACFVIVGETHPEVRKHEGEAYRLSLQSRARELGVDDHVVFFDQYIDKKTLNEFLSVADIVVTPYLNREQIVSGVLSFALGAGKAVVSTPYWYAEEVLAGGRGRLVPFRDGDAIAREVADLLSNDVERHAMRKLAYKWSRKMVWSAAAKEYLRLFREVRGERAVSPRAWKATPISAQLELPPPILDHMRVLTDGTGILQHSRFGLPDRDHGYCTDDNARALIVSLMAQHVLRDATETIPLSYRYLGFLQHAFNSDKGRFRNFMGYDRTWLEQVGSEDSHGRAMWALGTTVLDAPTQGMAASAVTLFEEALPITLDFTTPRSIAYTMLGVDAYLRRFSGASEARRARVHFAERLYALYRANAEPDWQWPEDMATYANGLIPHALIQAGARMDRGDMVSAGLRSLRWLMDRQTDPRGHFVPVGCRGWLVRGGRQARFDQQPIEAEHMIGALLEAHHVTNDRRWLEDSRRCFEWFLGRNDLQQPIADQATGGCRDGLAADGVNQNQGAESTLSWLHSLMRLHIAVGATVSTNRQTPADSVRRLTTPAPVARIAGSAASASH
ncbi:MAG: glycosyltransferase family 4 protein [Rhizobiales bacterium]|nr:glycosyltransferase family 4 protein [Hyphomicrobiales bacterium]